MNTLKSKIASVRQKLTTAMQGNRKMTAVLLVVVIVLGALAAIAGSQYIASSQQTLDTQARINMPNQGVFDFCGYAEFVRQSEYIVLEDGSTRQIEGGSITEPDAYGYEWRVSYRNTHSRTVRLMYRTSRNFCELNDGNLLPGSFQGNLVCNHNSAGEPASPYQNPSQHTVDIAPGESYTMVIRADSYHNTNCGSYQLDMSFEDFLVDTGGGNFVSYTDLDTGGCTIDIGGINSAVIQTGNSCPDTPEPGPDPGSCNQMSILLEGMGAPMVVSASSTGNELPRIPEPGEEIVITSQGDESAELSGYFIRPLDADPSLICSYYPIAASGERAEFTMPDWRNGGVIRDDGAGSNPCTTPLNFEDGIVFGVVYNEFPDESLGLRDEEPQGWRNPAGSSFTCRNVGPGIDDGVEYSNFRRVSQEDSCENPCVFVARDTGDPGPTPEDPTIGSCNQMEVSIAGGPSASISEQGSSNLLERTPEPGEEVTITSSGDANAEFASYFLLPADADPDDVCAYYLVNPNGSNSQTQSFTMPNWRNGDLIRNDGQQENCAGQPISFDSGVIFGSIYMSDSRTCRNVGPNPSSAILYDESGNTGQSCSNPCIIRTTPPEDLGVGSCNEMEVSIAGGPSLSVAEGSSTNLLERTPEPGEEVTITSSGDANAEFASYFLLPADANPDNTCAFYLINPNASGAQTQTFTMPDWRNGDLIRNDSQQENCAGQPINFDDGVIIGAIYFSSLIEGQSAAQFCRNTGPLTGDGVLFEGIRNLGEACSNPCVVRTNPADEPLPTQPPIEGCGSFQLQVVDCSCGTVCDPDLGANACTDPNNQCIQTDTGAFYCAETQLATSCRANPSFSSCCEDPERPPAGATNTPIPSLTPIPSFTPIPSNTPLPTSTPIPTFTPFPTFTPIPPPNALVENLPAPTPETIIETQQITVIPGQPTPTPFPTYTPVPPPPTFTPIPTNTPLPTNPPPGDSSPPPMPVAGSPVPWIVAGVPVLIMILGMFL